MFKINNGLVLYKMISDIFGIRIAVVYVLELITLLDSTHLISQLNRKGWYQ